MQNFIIVAIMNFFALLLVSNIMHGIVIDGWQTFVAASIVLSFINLILKPILKVIFLPINIISLGFFTLVINAVILYSTSGIVKGFYVKDFFSAFWGALLLSIIYLLLETFIIKRNIRILKFHDHDDEREEKNKSINSQVIDVEEIKDDEKQG